MPSYNDLGKHENFPCQYRRSQTGKMEFVAKISCTEDELRCVALSCNGFDKQQRAFHATTTTAWPTEISKKLPIEAYIIKSI